MNENVLQMITTLHARLDDVQGAVESLPVEAPEYATKLDKIDDKLYLLQREIEKLAASTAASSDAEAQNASAASSGSETEDSLGSNTKASVGEDVPKHATETAESSVSGEEASASTPKSSESSEGTSQGSEGKKKEIFSDDMKENFADAGRAIGNIYRDGKEVITELSGTMGDLKDIFSFGKKR